MTTTTASSPSPTEIPHKDRTRALWGSAIGSTIEWYDYFLYGTMSGLVFGPLFFPSNDPIVSQLLALASFALAFLIRPIGGIIFSHIGDRIGRKRTLVMTLTLMGLTTVAIGCVPSYATIGVAAPILLTLLRLLQGVALGGEWGGGLLLAVEYAPKGKRGFYGAVPQIGALLGLALGNFAMVLAGWVFPGDLFLSIGWRIPFIASIALLLLGLWIRHKVDETPSFRAVQAQGKQERVPIAATLRHHWREVLIATGAKFIETSTFFIFATFSITYAVSLGYERSFVLNMVLIGSLLGVSGMLFYGRLSDAIGRKKVFMGGTIAVILFILPYLWLFNSGNPLLLAIGIIVSFFLVWPTYGSLIGTLLAESFTPEVRYTGASLGYQLGAAIVGGPAPLIATALLAAFGGNYVPVGMFVIACGVVSLIAVAFAKERYNQDLDDLPDTQARAEEAQSATTPVSSIRTEGVEA